MVSGVADANGYHCGRESKEECSDCGSNLGDLHSEVCFQPVQAALTAPAYRPRIVIEQATSSYSFRFPELSQPI